MYPTNQCRDVLDYITNKSSPHKKMGKCHIVGSQHIRMLICLSDLFQQHDVANIQHHISASASTFLPPRPLWLPPLLLPHSFDSILRSARSSSQHLILSIVTLCKCLLSAGQRHLSWRCVCIWITTKRTIHTVMLSCASTKTSNWGFRD